MLAKKKATGRRGSWFASVDGICYPVLHSYWYSQKQYHDVNMTPAFCDKNPKAQDFIKALLSGDKAILAKSGPSNPDDTLEHFVRRGYIALFVYEFVSYDVDGLKLSLKERLVDLE